MKFEELLEDKKIEKLNEKQEIDFSLSESDINSAKNSFLSKDFDWALNIAYNSVLRAGRGVLGFFGFRVIGKEQHKRVFEFLRETDLNEDLIDYFDKIRIKRNQNVYDVPEEVEEEFAEEVIKKAEEFVQEIRTFVHKNRTGKKE